MRDGANGRPEEYLIQHSKACAKVNVVPDRGAWQHGREHGLERFCVALTRTSRANTAAASMSACARNFDQERLTDA